MPRFNEHTFVRVKGVHYVGVEFKALPSGLVITGPHSARAHFTPRQVFTRTLCLRRHDGSLVYGYVERTWNGIRLHELRATDIARIAWWGPRGWQWFDKPDTGPKWKAPAYLPRLDAFDSDAEDSLGAT